MKPHFGLLFLFLLAVGPRAYTQGGGVLDEAELAFAKETLRVMEVGDRADFKALIHPDVLKRARDEQIDRFLTDGRQLLALAPVPADNLIRQSKRVNISANGQMTIAEAAFPFTLQSSTGTDSTVYINLAFSDRKIVGVSVLPYLFGRRLVTPSHSEPHLNRHSLAYNGIFWFRIWYSSGFESNDYGDRFGYYAVSGDAEKLAKLAVEDHLTKLFTLLNTTPPDSTDFQYLREKAVGDPEYLYLRFRFDRPPYDEFDEFSVYHHLKDEPGKPEPQSRYIEVKHSKKTRYLYDVDRHPELVKVLEAIAYGRYDKYFEPRSM